MPAPGLGVGGGEQQLGVVGAQLERLGQEARGLVDGADGAGVLGRAGELRDRLVVAAGQAQVAGRLGGAAARARVGALDQHGGDRLVQVGAVRAGQVGVDGLAQERVAVAEAAGAGVEQAGLDGAAGGGARVVEGEADELAGVELAAGDRGQLGHAAGVLGQRRHGGAHGAAQARGRLALAGRERAGLLDRQQRVALGAEHDLGHVGVVERRRLARERLATAVSARGASASSAASAPRARRACSSASTAGRRGSSRRVSTTSTGRRGTRRAT